MAYLFFFLVFMFPTLCSGAGFSGTVVKGTYEYSVYQGSEKPLASVQYNFEVLIEGCSWIIAYEDPAALSNVDVLDVKTIASCDGTNIYLFRLQNQNAVKKAWGNQFDSVKSKLPVGMASIYSGNYPPPKEADLQNIWLAFASSCVLGNSKGKAKPPFSVDMAVFNNTNYNCDYYWTIDDSKQGRRELVFLDSGIYYARNPKTGQLSNGLLPSPYDKGYTTGLGKWLVATNFEGITMPMNFEFTAFSPKFKGATTDELIKAFTYQCIVTNVSNTNTSQVPTDLPIGKILICDRRFENQGHAYVTYEVTNGKWPAQNSSKLEQIIKAAPKISLEDEALAETGIKSIGSTLSKNLFIRQSYSKMLIIRTAICLVAALPIIFFVVKQLFSNKHNYKMKK